MTRSGIQRRLCRSALVMAAVFFWCIPSPAQEESLELDAAQTQIHFTLGATFHTVHGTFNVKRGAIQFDAATGKAGGLIVIDVASGETGNSSRDHKMHSEILESRKYPEATFAPDHVQGRLDATGDSHLDLRGVFRFHGADHAITLPVEAHRAGDRVTANSHFEIPYIQWGLKNPSTFVLRVSQTVEIDIKAIGRLKP